MHGGSRELHPANAEDNDETRTIGELKEQLEAQLASLNTQLASLNIKGNDDPEPSISRSTDNANAARLINATAKNVQFEHPLCPPERRCVPYDAGARAAERPVVAEQGPRGPQLPGRGASHRLRDNSRIPHSR